LPDLAALYLWNPFSILACISSSTSPLENAAVLSAAYGTVVGNPSVAAGALAAAGYLGLHPLLLAVSADLLGCARGGLCSWLERFVG